MLHTRATGDVTRARSSHSLVIWRNSLEIVNPLRLAGATCRLGARDDELAHDGGARATVVTVEADDDAVVLARADVVRRLGDVEQRVVYLEDVLRRVWEDVTERDGCRSARLYNERTLQERTYACDVTVKLTTACLSTRR